ncbi:hypothetical protein ACFZBM_14775 [Streptomyces lavendulae]|uniref:Uncharacterized protein n=1 Tax=Streptomyces lavendulae subsp. lavendulae TaxID=58340 RepID=A0A2K8PK09_STRLA|nr:MULTISPECIES: hypothetical protein [Streptomyces]ATZ25975.1 hypothetical protein SLAV_20765 [Streptomyces lavendulae subsp. lavendulae]MDH6540886.1 hypothetical protein [Streptomyces sp. SPB4]QUQ55804.1 hypothetical protein SLLC_18875 [Streptomyces lavendulae subsp. lavendulae]GLV98570.1 hypothetical protein Slala05_22020 [Streptomyces lavendulae subsp. lavendulae]
MERGPAIFAAAVFLLFGAALLAWTGARAVRRAPVAEGVRPVVAVPLALLSGAVSLALGVWCLQRF